VPQGKAAVGRTHRRLLSRADNPLVRAVGRLPAGVHAKLLVAFLGTALLMVILGALGLRLFGQSNERVETLGALQQRAFAYGKLRSDALHVRLLLAQNVGGDFYKNFPVPEEEDSAAAGRAIDRATLSAVASIPASTFRDSLGFRPPPEDAAYLQRIRATGERLSRVMEEVTAAGEAGSPRVESLRLKAELLAIDLNQRATELANVTTARADALTAQSQSAYERSRDLFIAAALGAIVLALFLGFVLSWSLIAPIQRIDARLAATASGDFSGHVEVSNRLYKELETASAHKSEFLASMSHELRTPLNAIIGFSQVLREEMFGELNDKQEEYLDDILGSAYHLLSLINDVLDLSRVEAGQTELQLAPFSLREALESGVVMVRERASEDGVQVELSADPDIDPVEGDERRIRQVVFNLLANAVKFTPEGGSIDVSAARVNGEVRVSVADTGPGVAPEDRERVFEEFQQTDVGVGLGEGTGLGLALSKRFVELHGGRIWVEGVVGGGSRFVFTLPAGANADVG
jgi:signal transduction histidine kinase